MAPRLSYPKEKLKVLLLENIHPVTRGIFEKEGYPVEQVTDALSPEDLSERIADVSILGIRSTTSITPEILVNAKRLLAIGAFCIGTNQIALSEAAGKGIGVFNAPYSNTRSVAELALGLVIMLYRGVFDKSSALHGGEWHKSAKGSYEIRKKKLGIVGYGNIGSQFSILAESLGMEVHFYDIYEKLPLSNTHKCDSLDELLRSVDVISLHVDGRTENINLFGEREFSLMKPGSLFLNLSRGFTVDMEALATKVKEGHIAGAAVDVFPNEPENRKDTFASPLQGLPNVILTPHIGGSTQEAQENIGHFVSERLLSFINEGSTTLSVNLPNVQLPRLDDTHRFLHIHDNVPGVLAKINNVLSENKLNIEGQHLATNQNVGYVITDVNSNYNNDVIESLKSIPGTVRFRVLY